jgi:exosortase C (VPDSG-CTERM-specific)
MNEPHEVAARGLPGAPHEPSRRLARPPTGFVLATSFILLAFIRPLFNLTRFALSHDLYSHILLIPFISAYLIWLKKDRLPAPSRADRQLAAVILGAGIAVLAAFWTIVLSGSTLALNDSLALTSLSFLLFFLGTCTWFFSRATLGVILFPLGFLVFIVPFPDFFIEGIETFLQYGSAAVAHGLFKLAGTTVYFQALTFQLPGISIQVAPECSGIHSSLALFITSLLASYFFLDSPGRRAILTLAVIPLALLRNGFRVFVIGELCVHISPDMINSSIHHHGGPLFFILSLVPFFLLLRWLVGSDRRATRQRNG